MPEPEGKHFFSTVGIYRVDLKEKSLKATLIAVINNTISLKQDLFSSRIKISWMKYDLWFSRNYL